jgi:hypothetical protein
MVKDFPSQEDSHEYGGGGGGGGGRSKSFLKICLF